MMAMGEERGDVTPVSLTSAVLRVLLSVVLALVALFGLVGANAIAKVLIATDTLFGPWAGQTALFLGQNLLMLAGGIGGVLGLRPWRAIVAISGSGDEDSPDTLRPAVMSVLLAFLTLMGFSAAAGVVGAVLFDPGVPWPVNWLTWVHLALFLLIGGAALWGLVRLKPWAGRHEPVSAATRKTNTLFGLGGGIATISCLVVVFHTMRDGDPAGFFSNGPVALWVALFAIATWLLSWAVSWFWYFSADEHEQRASDVGLLAGGFLFAMVTPAWWVAARAGLLPQPDAMVLWAVVNLIWGIGWFWRRNR